MYLIFIAGRVFFNIAGLTCYKYDHPIKRCKEYIDVTRMSKIPAIGYRLLRMLNVHPEPKRPRCRRYNIISKMTNLCLCNSAKLYTDFQLANL